MNNIENFTKNKYCILDNVLPPETLSLIEQYMLFDKKNRFNPNNLDDDQVPGAYSVYADPLMEALLIHLLPTIEKNIGLELYPTYSYHRIYKNGSELKPHKDRASCEITASLMIAKKYTNQEHSWPLFIRDNAFVMEPGDMVIYRGMELNHYRYPLNIEEDDYHMQCFLHYVDKNNIFSHFKFDSRKEIGIKTK